MITKPFIVGLISRDFVNECWGGLASMLVALPSSIAFGVLVFSAISPQLVGEGAFVGMMGAAALGLVAPLIGRTPALISAPCAPAAAVLSGLVIELQHEGIALVKIPALLALTALLASFLQILYGVLKGGQLIKYIPFPVVSGYLSGVGVIIAIGQIPKLLGLTKDTKLIEGLISPELWQWSGIVVGLITITVMLLAPRLTQKIPAAILGLFAGITAYFAMGLFVPSLLTLNANSLVIGSIHAGAPFFETVAERFQGLLEIRLTDLQLVGHSALALSALLSIDTLKTCLVLGALTKTRHDSNQELLGQGIANLASFFAGGMSGSGTMGPSLVNVTSGGCKNQSGIIEGGLIVLAILVLAPLIAWVPIASLAGILLVVAFRMFDWHAFRLLKHPDTRFDFAVIAAVVIVAESVGLIAASATGIGLAILLFIRDQIRISVLRRRATLKETSSKTYRMEEEHHLLQEHGDEAAVYELQGNLFFGTTDHLFSELEADLSSRKWLLFDMRRVQLMDYTAAHLFSQMKDRLAEQGGELLFSGMPSSLPSGQDLQKYMMQVGLIKKNGGGIRIFETRDEALEWMENQILQQAGWVASQEQEALDLSQIELLRKTDEQTIAALRPCVHELSIQAGEKLFTSGDQGDEIFLIRRGIVQIFLPLKGGKHHHLATFCRGDYLGEMAFLDHNQRSADAIAKTDCDFYVLSRKKFNDQVYIDSVLGVRIFARLARAMSLRLRQTDIELSALEER
jgi:sulfate permease, SulP family